MKAELAEKQPHLQKKKNLFHQDNTPYHTSSVTMAKIHELWFELLDHPFYSPDLAPSDFLLFHHLKIALGGQRVSSNEEAITFVNNYFAEKNAEYGLDGLQRWKHRWGECVELQKGNLGKNKIKKNQKKCLVIFVGRKLLKPPSHIGKKKTFIVLQYKENKKVNKPNLT
ncbi:histonelysine Nmethyltransferase SETMARlike [Trichonephila clavipes]|nr:histonelysine Nmethyltransferase SETMARlike [Trichonephila clavipes]